jgi:hypothetical protein
MKRKNRMLKAEVGAALFAALSLPLAAGTITKDMVVHLPFDNSYANTVAGGPTADKVGAPTFAAGKVGAGALAYSSKADGSEFNYVTLGTPEQLNFVGDVSFSVSFWAKLGIWTGDPAFLSNKDWGGGGNPGWVIATAGDGRIQWNFTDGTRRDFDSAGGIFSDKNWHHIVVTFDRAGDATAYVDGSKVDARTITPALDTLDSGLPTNIGQDGNGTYTDGGGVGVDDGQIDDVAIWRRVISAGEVTRIYSAALAGVNVANVPDAAGPTVTEYVPAMGGTQVAPAVAVRLKIEDAGTALDKTSVELSFDGAKVAHTLESDGKTNVVVYDPPGLLAAKSTHAIKLVFKDNGSPAVTTTKEYSFTVADYLNITVGAPLFSENFDAIEEGKLPTGWTVKNFTDGAGAGEDLASFGSDSYLDWVVINRQRLVDMNQLNRLEVAPSQYVNGNLVTNLVDGNFIYAESDTRSGNQIQYLFTKDYSLTGKKDIYLYFHSIRTQNQDDIASVEYSIDSGANWLPIVYMIDAADIILGADSKTDAVATLNEPRTDAAVYTDPDTGEQKGGTYGAFIGAPITADLAPYISGRVNDDQVESKRVEFFRIDKADNQGKVRFRFAQAGTGSWFFGVDSFAIYSVTQTQEPATMKIKLDNSTVKVEWSASGTLQSADTVNGTWSDVAGATSPYSVTPAVGAKFYRLKQ